MVREFVLWGIPQWGGKAIRVTSGTVAHCRREKAARDHGWWRDLRTYAEGTAYPADLQRRFG